MQKLLLFLLLVSALFISGCINENSTLNSENTSLPLQKITKLYIAPLPPGVDPKYANAIREAISFWEKDSNLFMFQEVNSSQNADVIIDWVKEFGTGTLGHITGQKFAEISLGDSQCLGKWRIYNYETVLRIAEHELGHALGGTDQYTDQNKIMYGKISTQYDTQIDETDILPTNYTRAYPLACSSKDTATFTINVQVLDGKPITVEVVPTKQDYDSLIANKNYNNYPSCSSENILSYNKTCTVPSSAYVILTNSDNETTKFRLTISEN